MKLDAFAAGIELRAAGERAEAFAAAGFDGLQLAEVGRTAYLTAAASTLAAPDLDIGTAVATALTRSPMVTAQTAWELAEASRGKFTLGLGTQVKAHIERRFSAVYDPPGARLKEYVLALRAIFRAFDGKEKLSFEGRFYRLSLLGIWTPGPMPYANIPIYLAAVRPWTLSAAGEVADGVHVHPLHSLRYLEEVVRPNVEAGAARAGRRASDVALACPVFTIVGDSEEERAEWRRRTRLQLAFYGSTPAYAGVFDLHGWRGVSERLHGLQRSGDLNGMAESITDEMLSAFAVEGTWDELPGRLVEKYRGVATRLIFYFAHEAWEKGPDYLARWKRVLDETRILLAAA